MASISSVVWFHIDTSEMHFFPSTCNFVFGDTAADETDVDREAFEPRLLGSISTPLKRIFHRLFGFILTPPKCIFHQLAPDKFLAIIDSFVTTTTHDNLSTCFNGINHLQNPILHQVDLCYLHRSHLLVLPCHPPMTVKPQHLPMPMPPPQRCQCCSQPRGAAGPGLCAPRTDWCAMAPDRRKPKRCSGTRPAQLRG